MRPWARYRLQKMLEEPKWRHASQRELARHLEVSQPRVCQLLRKIRANSTERVA